MNYDFFHCANTVFNFPIYTKYYFCPFCNYYMIMDKKTTSHDGHNIWGTAALLCLYEVVSDEGN